MDSTWGSYLYIGTNGNIDVNTAAVCTTNGNLHIDAANGNILYLNNYASSSYTVIAQSTRSPIYYDLDNTNYYCNSGGDSRFNNIVADRITFPSYGNSVIGVYASTVYQGVFAMGPSFVLPDDGSTTGSLYGLAWSHPNAGGVAGNLNTHGLLAMENGTWLASLSGSVRARDDMRAPYFYDRDNTGYYGDFAATSNFNALTLNSMRLNGGSQFLGNMNTASGSSPALQVYSESSNGAMMSFHRGGVYAVNMGLDSDNVIRIGGWSAGANRWQLDMSGNMYSAGNITAYSSDRRLKKNIVTITNAVSKVRLLRGVYYDWEDFVDELGFHPIDKSDIGVIAQEFMEVIPQGVKPAPFDTGLNGESQSGNNYLTVQMEKSIPLLIEAIKEQQLMIEALSQRIGELE